MTTAPAGDAPAWRVFHIEADRFSELPGLPDAAPQAGFLWCATTRDHFEPALPLLQAALPRWGLMPIVDLHVTDLANGAIPSHFDVTSWYDLMVFRRLALLPVEGRPTQNGMREARPAERDLPTAQVVAQARGALRAIDTQAVGFAVYDRVLISVHPSEALVRDFFVQRLASLSGHGENGRDARGARLPLSPSELMLRMLNHMVDGYLDLRRMLAGPLGELQQRLLDASGTFSDWSILLESRNTLLMLEDTCDDQHGAVQEWIDALQDWPAAETPQERRERELLRVRARDVLEHIERVLTHVRRLEQSAEAAMQLHFSALGHRTNDIMRTLTVLTALFLPLNLITGFFGMNFDGLPLIHKSDGAWIALGMMVVIAVVMAVYFWRRRFVDGHTLFRRR